MVYWLVSSFVSATLQILLEKLADFGIQARNSISNVDYKLGHLNTTVELVKLKIEVAEEKQVNSTTWQGLIQAVETAAYDADDVLDEILIKISKLEGGQHWPIARARNLLSCFFKTTSAPNMNDIQAKLDVMLRQIDSLSPREIVEGRRLDKIVSEVQTTSVQDKCDCIFGRDDDKERVLKMVVSSEESSRSNNVSVIPIVGMMGVGKTTLARLVYNHDYQAPFHLKMWVYVAKNFDVTMVTRAIIEVAKGESTSHLQTLESLQRKLIELLQGKKFLLVLDDLWNEERTKWRELLKPLQHGLKGSKIIVTTGSRVVSKLVGTTEPHYLKLLSDHDCWALIKEEALGGRSENHIKRFEEIGVKIAKMCKGLPVTAKIVGSLLKSKVDENEWNDFVESNIWELLVIRNELVPALRSGYRHLRTHYRQCFAYCSMFPEAYNFEKDKIIQMWMGEGFLTPDRGRRMIEDIGTDCFEELFLKSFFQMEGEMYKIHDAVHSLAQSVSLEKFNRVEDIKDSNFSENTRHLSLVCEKTQQQKIISEASDKCKGLRTFLLLCEPESPIKDIPLLLFAKLRRLRVLDLSSTQIDDLTDSIGNLKHLRFLDLSNTHLKWLPETMKELCALQTLRLLNCSSFLRLPKCIGRLKSLRHLQLGCSKLTSMPLEIGKLTGLLTINEFVVGPESGQMKELKHLNDVRGSLCVKQLENIKNPQEAADACLANKKHINKLELRWSSVIDARNGEHVLGMIAPHKSLKELSLKNYGGEMFPSWVSDPLFSGLTSISLSDCDNCVLLPSLGELPKLKTLKINGMPKLKEVDKSFIGGVTRFQSLETLEFSCMPELEQWIGMNDGAMACLIQLAISKCDKLVSVPSLHYLQNLKELKFDGCPKLLSLAEENLSRSIESLFIRECSVLKNRCEEVVGADWRKIKHIPYVVIDSKKVRTEGREGEPSQSEVKSPENVLHCSQQHVMALEGSNDIVKGELVDSVTEASS